MDYCCRTCSTHGMKEKHVENSVAKPVGRGWAGTARSKYEDNIKSDVKDWSTGCGPGGGL